MKVVYTREYKIKEEFQSLWVFSSGFRGPESVKKVINRIRILDFYRFTNNLLYWDPYLCTIISVGPRVSMTLSVFTLGSSRKTLSRIKDLWINK
jgi:hypothetical protein